MEQHTTPADLLPIYDQLKAGDIRMKVIEDQLAENNTLTAEIKDILDAAKLGFKVIGGLGLLLKWAAGLGAAIATIWAIWHGASPK